MGALSGYRVIEMAGIGPCPMAGMLLADMGAEVICVERSSAPVFFGGNKNMSARGKKSIVLDVKTSQGLEALLRLVDSADVLLEGYRPGVAEKLGFGPEVCAQRNPKLVYGRMTGWGQTGPLAKTAGHDINYIAITGALHAMGQANKKPMIPLNLVGDFGGGTMFLISGVLAALLESKTSGVGQVVDAAMIDGAANLMWMCHSFASSNQWNTRQRGVNLLDGGAYFYNSYETSDGKYISVGSLEPQFYQLLIEKLGLDPEQFNINSQNDPRTWQEGADVFTELFKTRTRDQWCELLEGTEVCFAPILELSEVPEHAQNSQRDAYIEVDGYLQPAPAPRLSRTPSAVEHGQRQRGEDTIEVLKQVGYSEIEIKNLKDQSII